MEYGPLEHEYARYTSELWVALQQTLSIGRQQYFSQRAGQDEERAFYLHQWNAQLSEALYFPMQMFEITLRNTLDKGLTKHYENEGIGDWYRCNLDDWRARWCKKQAIPNCKVCGELLEHIDKALSKARKEEAKDQRSVSVTLRRKFHDNFIASTDFYLWTLILHNHFDKLWKQVLCEIFPKPIDRKTLYDLATGVRVVRNRVMHYEPVFYEKELCELHNEVLNCIYRICPLTGAWVEQTSRFVDAWRLKPQWLANDL